MIVVQKNISLAQFTTFKIGGRARYYVLVKNKSELLEALNWARQNKQPLLLLGGGSNLLISDQGFKGLVIHNHISGVRVVKTTKDYVWVEADSGEPWSALVGYCLNHKYYGLENLALIPGTVGAAPMQNIGAYGVELKDVFVSLVAINLKNGREKKFSLADCAFGYRESAFKNKLKGKYFIYSVTVKLSKRPNFKLSYGGLQETLSGQANLTARDVVKAIAEVRISKLPSPAILPNAGSFFKNPEIARGRFLKLQKKFPTIKHFVSGERVKIPAAWLIEACGFKGKRFGKVGAYEKQPLVLVNYGGAKASEILGLVKKIEKAVQRKFEIKLEREVNCIN